MLKKKNISPVGFNAKDTSLNDSPWNGHSKFTLYLALPNLLVMGLQENLSFHLKIKLALMVAKERLKT